MVFVGQEIIVACQNNCLVGTREGYDVNVVYVTNFDCFVGLIVIAVFFEFTSEQTNEFLWCLWVGMFGEANALFQNEVREYERMVYYDMAHDFLRGTSVKDGAYKHACVDDETVAFVT